MFEIKCERCGSKVIPDEMSTRDEYLKDMSYMVDVNGKLLDSSVQQYLIYMCIKCGESYKLSHKEWEKRFRKKIAEDTMHVRKVEAFKKMNPYIIDPDNGLEFCGQCDGIDKEGHCYVDIIKQCTMRK